YIVWTDDDVMVDEEWLELLVEGFVQNKADWVFGPSQAQWPDAVPDWYSPRFANRFALLGYGPTPFVLSDLAHPFYGLNMAGTREAHRVLGGFHDDLGGKGTEGAFGEDLDMFARALEAGMTIFYTPHALVRHVIAPARTSRAFHRRAALAGTSTYYRR